MPVMPQKVTHILSPKRSWMPLVAFLVGLLVTCLANLTGKDGMLAGWWTNGFDPVITMATLTLAGILWFRAWADELPKRLNIHFKYEGRYALTCWEASLAGEDDIRQWAQQIGRQMSRTEGQMSDPYLDFDPYPQITAPTTARGPLGWRQVYEITINLTKEPPANGYKVWGPNPDDRAEVDERPALPMTVEGIRRVETAKGAGVSS